MPEPKIELLASSVNVLVRERRFTGRVADDLYFTMRVDEYGLVEIDPHVSVLFENDVEVIRRKREERRQEAVDFLLDCELATWQAIGPEDSELFLTSAGRKQFEPLIAELQRWHWTEWKEA